MTLAAGGVTGLDWVDAVVIVAGLLALFRGLRLGAVAQLLSYGGFWLGLVVGAALAPLAEARVHALTTKAAVALAIVLGAAVVVGSIGGAVGRRFGQALRRLHLGALDSLAGMAIALAATLLACWALGSILVVGPSPTLASGIARSRILRAVDAALPAPPQVLGQIRQYVDTTGLPQVFSGLGVDVAGPVPVATSPAVSAAVAAAGPSMVQIEGPACGEIVEGSGFVVAPGLVVTNAHVVAGVADPTVIDRAGARHPSTAVLDDPRYDLAVLSVPGLTEPALHLDASTVARATTGSVLGYPEGGPFRAVPAGVDQLLTTVSPDIYGHGSVTRQVYAITAVVLPGNSGGPLVGPDGQVVGVVFSRSTTNGDLGYALASPGVLSRVHQAEAHPAHPGTGACTTGA